MSSLRVQGLRHRFGHSVVLEDVQLHLPAGRVLALLGSSGCGKTTLLHLCAGLLEVQEGQVQTGLQPQALMFQQPRLLPWLQVLPNIALGLKARGLPKAGRHALAQSMALALGLPQRALQQYPAELSGGMQSRVALARALVLEPALLLMDEPFSALDVGLRSQLQQLLLEQQQARAMAVLLITHDVMEAVRLADEVLVMAANPGRIVGHYYLPGPASARDDALVHQCAAQLLQQPLVRQVFDLPPTPLAAGAEVLAGPGRWEEGR